MDHGDHGDSPQRFINLVDHAVGATAGAMSVPQQWVQSWPASGLPAPPCYLGTR